MKNNWGDMMDVQNKFIEILEAYILKSENELKKYYHLCDQKINEKVEIFNLLEDNFDNFVKINFKDVKNIIYGFSFSDERKEKMITELNKIRKKIQRNKSGVVKFKDVENDVINEFLTSLKKYISNKNKYLIEPLIDEKIIEKKIKKYKKIHNLLVNNKKINFINDIDLLNEIFDNSGISLYERYAIYRFIFKYNKAVFDRKICALNLKELEVLGKFDLNMLKGIFEKYNYDFDKLPGDIQENIINKAIVSNIEEVLCALEKNGYRLNLENDSYLLMSLVVYGDKSTINYISNLAFSKGLTCEQILKIGGILINQKDVSQNSINVYDRFYIDRDDDFSVVGSALDFEKNIKELSMWGISVSHVYNCCKYVLACSNDVLSHNLSLFQDYGFSLRKVDKKLCSAVWSALMEYNTFEIIDRFIEVHPLSLQYLRSNLSVLRQVNSLEDLLFYKLYYSNKYCGFDEAFFNIITNDDSQLQFQGKVSGLTSIYIDSYKDITFANRRDVTGTFVPIYSYDYNTVVKSRMNRKISSKIFDNLYIQHINRYSDYSEPLLYNFDGIIISKLKVLRVFDTLLDAGINSCDESFLFAVLYNTIINKEDYEKIKNMIKLNG